MKISDLYIICDSTMNPLHPLNILSIYEDSSPYTYADHSISENESISTCERDFCWNENAIGKEIFTRVAEYAQALVGSGLFWGISECIQVASLHKLDCTLISAVIPESPSIIRSPMHLNRHGHYLRFFVCNKDLFACRFI